MCPVKEKVIFIKRVILSKEIFLDLLFFDWIQ
jgi:hypothetical protein